MELSEKEKSVIQMALDHAEEDRGIGLQKAIETWEKAEEIEQRFGPNTFGAHEAVDRAHLIMENWEFYVCDHPTVLMDPEIHRMARIAATLMAEVYNAIATKDCLDEASETEAGKH